MERVGYAERMEKPYVAGPPEAEGVVTPWSRMFIRSRVAPSPRPHENLRGGTP